MNSPYRTSSESPPATKQIKSDNLTARIHYLNKDGEHSYIDQTWKGTAQYYNYTQQIKKESGSRLFYYWRIDESRFRQIDDEGKLYVHVDRITTIQVLNTEDITLSVEVPTERP